MSEKEMTALETSVGADAGQPFNNIHTDIITQNEEENKGFDDFSYDFQREWLLANDTSYLKTVTMDELYETTFDVNLPIIEGVLYPGTYLFAGPSKVGKSFFMAQLAYHVSTGIALWGNAVRKGTVLYLALEDDYARLQRRFYRMFGTDSTPNLHLATEARVLGDGFDEQIKAFIRNHPDTKLIIIDVLQRVRDVGGKDYSYASDYDIVAKLKAMTEGSGVALLIVHHTRKQHADDIFDMISGTNGLMGAADGAFIISKETRTGNGATVAVVGRDQPDQRFHLQRNVETLAWELEKAENELWVEPKDPLLELISSFLSADRTSWSGTPTELVTLLGVDLKPNVLSLKLNINAGRLLKEYGIFYKSSRSHDGRRVSLSLAEPRRA